MSKEADRKAAFARRAEAHREWKGRDVCGPLREALGDHAGAVLAGYRPIRSEIDPTPVMAGWSGEVGVPVIRAAGQGLVFSQWTPDAVMVDGPFGARVPEVERLIVPGVLIVPLVAFSRHGARLGYGGGFYDRTLEALRARGTVTAIGFAYAAQEADALEQESTDQQLDLIVTERDIIRP